MYLNGVFVVWVQQVFVNIVCLLISGWFSSNVNANVSLLIVYMAMWDGIGVFTCVYAQCNNKHSIVLMQFNVFEKCSVACNVR